MNDEERRAAILGGLRQHPYAREIEPPRLGRMADVLARRLSSVTVVLENLFSSHNFSAIVRTAEALGLHEAHIVEALHTFRKARGVTHGADRWLEVRRHKELDSCLSELRREGFVVACGDIGAGCVQLEEVPVDQPVAVVLGSEKAGLSDAARAAADLRFTIPMPGFTESFNVSVSAAIALYSLQQRRRARIACAGDLESERAVRTGWGWLEATRERRTRTRR